MKKIIFPIIICLAAICAGVAMVLVGSEKEAAIEPVDFSSLSENEILPGMYVGSDETVVYESFAYYGESEELADTDFYITVTGIDTEEGAQYMTFSLPRRSANAAEAHMEKTLAWEQDETMETPTGFPIKGVVKEMTAEMRRYFEEYFIDVGWFTQEQIEDYPELFSQYYIDTESTPDTYRWYIIVGGLLVMGAVVGILTLIIVAASNKNKARYTREHAVANTANMNLDDSTDVPLGFDK